MTHDEVMTAYSKGRITFEELMGLKDQLQEPNTFFCVVCKKVLSQDVMWYRDCCEWCWEKGQ